MTKTMTKTMMKTRTQAQRGALALMLALTALPALAEDTARKAGVLRMTGTGEVRFAPDMAIITLGKISQAKTARDALNSNTKAMSEAIALLKSAGVDAKDLQTINFRIEPQYTSYSSKTTSPPPVIASYQVTNDLVVRVRDLTKIGDILDKAVSVGANSIEGPVFTTDNLDKAREDARKAAIANALAKAKLYTSGLNVDVGRVINIEEHGMVQPRPAPMARMSADVMMASAPAPIEAGEGNLSLSVSVTWEIAQ